MEQTGEQALPTEAIAEDLSALLSGARPVSKVPSKITPFPGSGVIARVPPDAHASSGTGRRTGARSRQGLCSSTGRDETR
jgi:hypothetical protein